VLADNLIDSGHHVTVLSLRRSGPVLCAALTALGMLTVTEGPASASAGPVAGRLGAGQCMTTSTRRPVVDLPSRSGAFDLVLSRTKLFIHDEVLLTARTAAGYTTWSQPVNHGSATSARLCMERDGNLVLRGDSAVAWSTHTSGSGAHNYARMRDDGALVVRTGTGRLVWSSRTTRVLLTAGDRLRSGGLLRNTAAPGGVTSLAMQRDGDLVLRRDRIVEWRSGSRVAGAHLNVTSGGRLVVRAPSGRAVWRSTAVGGTPLLTVATRGRITLESFATGGCWAQPDGNCR
jgi:hypothetical protein